MGGKVREGKEREAGGEKTGRHFVREGKKEREKRKLRGRERGKAEGKVRKKSGRTWVGEAREWKGKGRKGGEEREN